MQFKELKKIRPNLFQEVKFDPESADSAALVLLCALVFGAGFFAGGKVMGGYDEKVAQLLQGEKVLASENQKIEDAMNAGENNLPGEKKISEVLSGAADAVKNLAVKTARAKKISREKTARAVFLRNTPPPRTSTKRVDGKRVCDKKNDKPHESGKTGKSHMDMECCPDPDEWPNPHCYYTPQQLSRMQKPPK